MHADIEKKRIAKLEKIRISDLVNLKKELILASKSPRRRQLLEQLGFEFEVIPASIDEDDFPEDIDPAYHVANLALKKALFTAKKIVEPSIVLGSDTIVVLNGRILNKPQDAEDAVRMLQTLSGNTHTVFSGIALVETDTGRQASKTQATQVTFRHLNDDEIRAYVKTGSPLDKAGGYGIQDDFGAVFVSRVEGCYYNIVGLPLELLYVTMRDFLKVEKNISLE
mgnify:CR=1 FL=1